MMGAVWLPMLVAFAVVRVPFTIVDATPFLQAIAIMNEIKRMHWGVRRTCSADADGDGICDDGDSCIGKADEYGVCNGPGAIYDCGCIPIPDGFAIAMAHRMQTTMAFVMTSMTASVHRMPSVYATARVRPMRMETGSVTTMEGDD